MLTLNDRLVEVLVEAGTQVFNVQIAGHTYEIDTGRGRRGGTTQDDQFINGIWLLRAPLTGVVIDVRVAAGEAVEAGTVLVVVEAMKMLNELRSRVAGLVTAVNVEERQRVEIGTVLIEVGESSV
ncbi:MAG TPA: acetyl-CoA carboxylase biotin carboxyl carrier protein subunit [Dehalococcoidia bacterium]|nr:acetyl-CoA carboxylase biotin carboxyl carrier protein subunit [Dehalococcoidia bacterium]